jgi:hypothetical protein
MPLKTSTLELRENGMPSPFRWVKQTAQPRLLVVLSILLIGLSIWLTVLGEELVSTVAPSGIVSFELAGHAERSAVMLDSWGPGGREAALLIQGLDFLYLLVYPAWFSLAAALLGSKLGAGWHRAGSLVSWSVLGSAPLDAIENHALIQQLIDGPSQFYAQLAWWCAVPKFLLVVIAAGYLLIGTMTWLIFRSRSD